MTLPTEIVEDIIIPLEEWSTKRVAKINLKLEVPLSGKVPFR